MAGVSGLDCAPVFDQRLGIVLLKSLHPVRTGRHATSVDPELMRELLASRPADAVHDPAYLPMCSRDLWSP